MDDFFDSFKGKPKYDHKVRVVHFKKEPFDIYIGRLPNGKFNKWGYLEPIFFKKIEIDKNFYNEDIDIENKYSIPIEVLDFSKNRIDAHGGRYILPKK